MLTVLSKPADSAYTLTKAADGTLNRYLHIEQQHILVVKGLRLCRCNKQQGSPVAGMPAAVSVIGGLCLEPSDYPLHT